MNIVVKQDVLAEDCDDVRIYEHTPKWKINLHLFRSSEDTYTPVYVYTKRPPYAKTNIRIVFGADPGTYNTVIAAISDNLVLVCCNHMTTPPYAKTIRLVFGADQGIYTHQ